MKNPFEIARYDINILTKFRPKGVYSAVDYHPESSKLIHNLICKDLEIVPDNGLIAEQKKPGNKFHTTIIYHEFKNESPQEKIQLLNYRTHTGKPIVKVKEPAGPDFDLFGKRISIPKLRIPIKIIGFGFFNINTDGKKQRNLHIRIWSKFLETEYNRAKKAGFKFSYSKYHPHITLKNDVPDDFKIDPKIIKKYQGTTLYTNDQYLNLLNPNQ